MPSRRIRTTAPCSGVEHEADDQAGGECAEHEVEADVVREPDERGEHEHGQPHRRLPGGVHGVAQDAQHPRAAARG